MTRSSLAASLPFAAVAALSFAEWVPAQAPAAATLRPAVEFVANRGQWAPSVRFLAEQGGLRTWVVDDGLWLTADAGDIGTALHFGFEGAGGENTGEAATGSVRHWLRSVDAGGSVTFARAFARVRHSGLYPGIDLVLRQADGHLEYDLVLGPGADLAQVRVRVAGHDRMRLLPDGSLRFDTAVGELRQTAPRTWSTDASGRRTELTARFVQHGSDEFGFQVDGWRGGELTIDPGLIWGTFLGGGGVDRCTQLGIDSLGRTVVGGTTTSANLPTTPGCYRPNALGGADAFVAVFTAGGSGLVWCTYVGGTGDETVDGLRVISGDRVAISGTTFSFNFPVTANRFQAGLAGGLSDGYVAILSGSGSALEYSSYYGGTGEQSQMRLWMKPNDDIFLAGRTTGTVPTSGNSYQGARNGVADAFFAVLDRSSPGSTSLRYGTYFGGSGDEVQVTSIYVDPADPNEITTIGMATTSTDCPITATFYQSAFPGGVPSGFIVSLQPVPPTGLAYASYFGQGNGTTDHVVAEMDSLGILSVTATTSATTWPTTVLSFQRNYGGGATDGFVCRVNTSVAGSTALGLMTYLGGSGDEVLEASTSIFTPGIIGLITVVGSTTSTNFPVTAAALQPTPPGTGTSGFVAQVDMRVPALGQLAYGSYFDGCGVGGDALHAVRRDASGLITVAGETNSAVAPGTPGGFRRVSGGGTEGIVAQLDRLPQPSLFSTFGSGCGVPGFVPVITAGTPPRMCQPFLCNISNLQTNAVGLMFMGLSNTNWFGIPLPRDLATQGMPGCNQLISIEETFLVLGTGNSATFGFLTPGSMNFYGVYLYLQYAMLDPAANAFGVAVSNGAALNFQF